MDMATWFEIRDEATCISQSTKPLGKGMNPTILSPAMGKGKLGSLILVWQLVEEKENSKFKPVKLCLKTDIVSHAAHGEGVDKYIHYH